jgi:hypothetical protein
MFAQVDDESHQYQILEEIINHHKDHTAIPASEGMVKSANGTTKPRVTTHGWQHLVCFKDRSVLWVKLKDLKESNLTAEYAITNCIVEEPAYKWWVPQIL